MKDFIIILPFYANWLQKSSFCTYFVLDYCKTLKWIYCKIIQNILLVQMNFLRFSITDNYKNDKE